MILNYWNR